MSDSINFPVQETYHIASLLLLGCQLLLLEDVGLTKGRAERVSETGWCSGHLHGALEGRLGSHWDGDGFSVAVVADVTKTDVGGLRLGSVRLLGVGKGRSRVDWRVNRGGLGEAGSSRLEGTV